MFKQFRTIAATSVIALTALCAPAQNTMTDPMTQAMMEVYDSEISANPKAYDIYFRRANEYYKYNQYLRALSDIDNALKYAPSDDKDFLFQCYSLKGDIFQMLEKPEDALTQFTKALELDPTSFITLYQKANCEYELGQYAQAKIDYNRLRANNGRSVEALTGLARIAVKENNLGLASEYMNDAVAMMPSDSDIYIRRSSIRRMLGNNTGAVDDLLMAISIDSSPKAFQQLVDISNDDYPAVITALSNAIHQAPEQGMFYYIRAVIAQAHNHFPQAIDDYNRIIDENLYNYAGIYGALAECQFALNQLDEAADNANRAIGMTRDNGEYLITLAKVANAQKRYAQALEYANSALEKLPDNSDATTQKALALVALGRADEASTIFGEMIMDNPDKPENYLYRATILNDILNKPQEAKALYTRMADLSDEKAPLSSLRGFALLGNGKKFDAISWLQDAMAKKNDTDGQSHFIAAALYAQAGETDNAMEALEIALDKGFANKYAIACDTTSPVNLAALHSLPRFQSILANYSYLFQ